LSSIAASPFSIGDALTTLRPGLMRSTRRQLQARGLDDQLTEDLVQEAIVRWFAKHAEYRGLAPMAGWLRSTISRLVSNMDRRRRDALDNAPYSLDTPWGRGD
jgi:DNA-directed RNA polymerase specialized sigma24 family protein